MGTVVLVGSPDTRVTSSWISALQGAGHDVVAVSRLEELPRLEREAADLVIGCVSHSQSEPSDMVRAVVSAAGRWHCPSLLIAEARLDEDAAASVLAEGVSFAVTDPGARSLRARLASMVMRAHPASMEATLTSRASEMPDTCHTLPACCMRCLDALAGAVSEGLLLTDADAHILYMSPRMEQMLGWAPASALGQQIWTLVHPDERPQMISRWASLVGEPGATDAVECRVRDRVRTWRRLRIWAVNRLDSPPLQAVLLACTDVQAGARLAQALRYSTDRFRRFMETAQEGIWITDERDRTVYMSDRMAAMLGYKPHELHGRTPESLMPEEDRAAYRERMKGRVAGQVDIYEQRFVRVTGSILWTRIAATPTYDESGAYSGSFGMVQDITAEKVQEQAHRDELARFTALIENTPVIAVQGFDRDGLVMLWNAASATLYGYSKEEALGKRIQDLLLPETEVPRFERTLKQVCETCRATPVMEWNVRTRDGETRHLLSTIVPVQTDSGISIYCMDVDITDRVLAEQALEASRQELADMNARLERMVAERTADLKRTIQELEAFVYSVSHDLKAPLRAMTSYATLLETEAAGSLSGDALRHLSYIVSSAERMNELIEGLLRLSRAGRQTLTCIRLDMNRLVEEVLTSLEPSAVARAEVRVETLPTCYGDPPLVKQVLANLLDNALKYSRTREHPRIEVFCAEHSGGMVWYAVRDNGIGFDPEQAGRLFGVFQRLTPDPTYEGIGVGLSLVRRIVYRHGGDVRAEGQPDRGATFYFSLPDHPFEEQMGKVPPVVSD